MLPIKILQRWLLKLPTKYAHLILQSLRSEAVASCIHTLKLSLDDLSDAKQQLQDHPKPAVIRWVYFALYLVVIR